jgi:hypothetical protein
MSDELGGDSSFSVGLLVELRTLLGLLLHTTGLQRTIVPLPAAWRRMSSTNRSTAPIPSFTYRSSEALNAQMNVSIAERAVSSCMPR